VFVCFRCTIQRGRTPLQLAASYGKMAIVKCLVEECHAVITTQNMTPISAAEKRRYTTIAHYLKAQVMKMVMGLDSNLLPFYGGVRGIIATYLQG